ncbi:hypothetical protein AAHH78_40905, partial [Burkholderia pseudomallei]
YLLAPKTGLDAAKNYREKKEYLTHTRPHSINKCKNNKNQKNTLETEPYNHTDAQENLIHESEDNKI